MSYTRRVALVFISSTILIWIFYGELDKRTILYMSQHQETSLEMISEFISLFGEATYWIIGTILLWIYWRFYKKNRANMLRARDMLIAIVTTGIAVNVLKMLFGKARPDKLIDEGIYGFTWFATPTQYSLHGFPSGHTTLAFTVATALAIYLPRYAIYFYLFAALIALSRIGVLYHYPTDIFAGAALGVVLTVLLFRYLRY